LPVPSPLRRGENMLLEKAKCDGSLATARSRCSICRNKGQHQWTVFLYFVATVRCFWGMRAYRCVGCDDELCHEPQILTSVMIRVERRVSDDVYNVNQSNYGTKLKTRKGTEPSLLTVSLLGSFERESTPNNSVITIINSPLSYHGRIFHFDSVS